MFIAVLSVKYKREKVASLCVSRNHDEAASLW